MDKQQMRDSLASAVAEFEARGGVVESLPIIHGRESVELRISINPRVPHEEVAARREHERQRTITADRNYRGRKPCSWRLKTGGR